MPDTSLIETLAAEKPTHTPGPWAVGRRDDAGIRIFQRDAGNMGQLGRKLAYVSAPIFPSKKGESQDDYDRRFAEQEAANARLIAAAPELLAVLKLARIALQNSTPDRDQFPEADYVHKGALAACDAAIAKAEAGK